ncbi:MAG TPA: YCF48-related protein [Methylomirabilota bacterium]|nr:YCF48-related protein [Methylomirabilota bacterium]
MDDGVGGGYAMRKPTCGLPFAPALLLILALLLAAGCGQRKAPQPASGWEPLPLGTVAEFRSLWFVDAMNGWIVGGSYQIPGGLVGRTRDGGKSWRFESGIVSKGLGATRFNVEAVRFFDVQRGLVATDGGMIFTTSDGGDNWGLVRHGRGPTDHLFDLDFIDDRNGWAVGLGGVLRTQDAGVSWVTLRRHGEKRGVSGRAIRFLDSQNGWLVGQHATLMSTRDGGTTWSSAATPLATGEKPHLSDVFFLDDQNGWVVGDEGTILHTQDGGHTWILQDTGLPDARSAPRLERIRRGSKVEVIDAGDRTPGLTLTAVRFVDKERGWVVGHFAGLGRSLILRSQDGGATWAIDADIAGEELRALFALDPDHVWAIGARVREGAQAIYRRAPSATRPAAN